VFGLKPVSGEKPKPISRRCQGLEAVASQCERWSREGVNAYFSLASFLPESRRLSKNVVAMRTLWLDIDIGKAQNSYAEPEDALRSLLGFVDTVGLPSPLIVCSGKGLHVYWPFTKDVDREKWLWLAKQLAAATAKYGLVVDPARTKDAASVPRPPGTNNYGKDGKTRKVYILDDAEPTDPTTLGGCLCIYAGDTTTKKTNLTTTGVGVEFSGVNLSRDNDPSELALACPQILYCGTAKASYLSWFYMLVLMHFCQDGLEAAHVISQQDVARYDAHYLNEQFNHGGTYGPVLCEKFQAENPEPCLKCKWSRLVKHPIAALKASQKPKENGELEPFKDEEFEVIPDKGLYHLVPSKDPKRSEPLKVHINHNEFYISEIHADTEGLRTERFIKIKTRYRGGVIRRLIFP
jgi:hypothetical protein